MRSDGKMSDVIVPCKVVTTHDSVIIIVLQKRKQGSRIRNFKLD